MDKRFELFAKTWIGENWDEIDIYAEWDNKLTLKENIEQFKHKFTNREVEDDKCWEEQQQDHIIEQQKEELFNAFGEEWEEERSDTPREIRIPDMPTIELNDNHKPIEKSYIEQQEEELKRLWGE